MKASCDSLINLYFLTCVNNIIPYNGPHVLQHGIFDIFETVKELGEWKKRLSVLSAYIIALLVSCFHATFTGSFTVVCVDKREDVWS